jgi:hypothetical protein
MKCIFKRYVQIYVVIIIPDEQTHLMIISPSTHQVSHPIRNLIIIYSSESAKKDGQSCKTPIFLTVGQTRILSKLPQSSVGQVANWLAWKFEKV